MNLVYSEFTVGVGICVGLLVKFLFSTVCLPLFISDNRAVNLLIN